MGLAVAKAALAMGADVSLVTGPTNVVIPTAIHAVRVETADQMLEQSRRLASGSAYILGVAAVADYRPSRRLAGKHRRSDQPLNLELVPNPDIIATLAAEYSSARVIGFAAEPEDSLHQVREKLRRKGLFAIAANNVGNSEIGFDSDVNELTLIQQDGAIEKSGRRSKLACAIWLLEKILES
jgi:phosphopantothenoylcysteine decarboxylase/phosphopantothenate--cysteine ligase